MLTYSPIDFGRFTETYSDRPEWLHVAGSIWHKKNTERVMEIASLLHDRFAIRTLVTSMGEIPERYTSLPWVEAHPHASRETYERALQRGDLAICASEYETLARTWFEQAASGQVLLLRDEPWIYDCVPTDYDLVADLDELGDLAVRAVEDWTEAVAENRRMVEHVRRVRDPERAGRRTYDDLRRHVAETERSYPRPTAVPAVERVLDELDADHVPLDELDRRAASVAPELRSNGDGSRPANPPAGEPLVRRLTDRDSTSHSDLVFALRALGYEDTGDPGTPVFRATGGR